ncbi:MAG: helix-turn-helix domain-containing protein [Bacteroidales bacterium]
MKRNIDKFDALISKRESKWNERVKERNENSGWSKKASDIAIKILIHLRKSQISQTDLAGRMGVSRQYISKILQGKENLGLSTICKLEEILGISLIETNIHKSCETDSDNNHKHKLL